ncbi:MAG: lipoprotein signal peptidase [Flavobacteriales bacterium]|nr:lipoprotein signal peptidase [Flavobacteriales bacterium]NNK81362.1 lipoprotein signal peptidase [Flavobacteriales bacterium]
MRQALITLLSVLTIDQVSKVWVKLNMYQNEKFPVLGEWFYIHFLENRGMAFGFEFGGEWGKIALSLFRVIAVVLIARYIYKFIKQEYHPGFIIFSTMVLAGALGNIIDSAVYGLVFSESPPNIPITAEFMPSDGGYAPFLMGNVVDMLHFPLFSFNWPDWVPSIGGTEFEFFRPVFNIADSAITVGLACIFIFQKRFFPEEGLKAVLADDDDSTNSDEE